AERGPDVVAGTLTAEVLVERPRPRDGIELRVRDEPIHLARDDQPLLAVDLGPLHRTLAKARIDVPGERVGSLVVVIVGVEGQEPQVGHRALPPARPACREMEPVLGYRDRGDLPRASVRRTDGAR